MKRVDAHGDKVWDGALKGAVFGASLALITGLGARFALQAAISYALVRSTVCAAVLASLCRRNASSAAVRRITGQ